MTLSIAGFCRETGQFGAAITSSSICVASRCVFVGPRRGVVLTQNVTNPVLGQLGVEHLQAGRNADDVLAKLLESEVYPEWRQLQVLDADGSSAVHSGAKTLGIHATVPGLNCVAGGNMLASADVVAVTVAAFENAQGELAERLLVALSAGVEAGGEMGPVHSAGLQVTDQSSWPAVDLRVDWHETPIAELRKLWELYRPQRDDYVCRAVRPDESPSYGVPGDIR